jgi:hypothetical protein
MRKGKAVVVFPFSPIIGDYADRKARLRVGTAWLV